MQDTGDKGRWVIVAVWFGTIAFLGVLKRVLEKQREG